MFGTHILNDKICRYNMWNKLPLAEAVMRFAVPAAHLPCGMRAYVVNLDIPIMSVPEVVRVRSFYKLYVNKLSLQTLLSHFVRDVCERKSGNRRTIYWPTSDLHEQ